MSNGISIEVSGQDYDIEVILDGTTIFGTLYIAPHYTTTERNLLTNVLEGTLIWNTTTKRFNVWDGSAWNYIALTAGA